MTRQTPWQLAVAAALLVLLATLATVQYRWLGDVSQRSANVCAPVFERARPSSRRMSIERSPRCSGYSASTATR